MRDGRVLDAGTPAELVARHAGQATVRFRARSVSGPDAAGALQELDRLPGATRVSVERGQVLVRGHRDVIAHVGAWLVARPEPIPEDLSVDVPDLESALLNLLEQPRSTEVLP
jgi:ABC-2 type transport system ATP-binding protein